MSRELDIVTKAKLIVTKYKSIRDLKSACLVNEFNANSLNFSRIFLWKLLVFYQDEQYQDISFTELLNPESHHYVREVTNHRHRVEKFFHDLEVPWYQLPKDSIFYQEAPELDIGTRHAVTIDPLTQPSTNEDKLMLELIILDVERLFPQEPELFIDNLKNKIQLVELLFLSYKDFGYYKQGIHELMGLIFKAIEKETLPLAAKADYSEPIELQIFELYQEQHFKTDVYIVFTRLITSVLENMFTETAILQESIKFNLKLHELDKMLYHVLLTKLKLQTPIWILRYLRLCLLREIGIDKSLLVWDRLVAFDSKDITKLLPFLIILMLLQIREFILESENDEVLYALLHYPEEEKFTNIPTLLQDSILLYNSSENLAALSKIMLYKYCRKASNDSQLKRMMSLKKKKTKSDSQLQLHQQNGSSMTSAVGNGIGDGSIGGNDIVIPNTSNRTSSSTDPDGINSLVKDFERTRLELRLKKKVSGILNSKKH